MIRNNIYQDPREIPEWRALSRECRLVRDLIGSGVTALGKANYADKKGEYYNAFFGLSVGVERLTKLIMIADGTIQNGGQFPSEKKIKKFGHKISDLIDRAEEISNNNSLNTEYCRPNSDISVNIISCLDAFADAGRGRYANFAALGDPNIETEFEPIHKWWVEVAEKILDSHYNGKKFKQKLKAMLEL